MTAAAQWLVERTRVDGPARERTQLLAWAVAMGVVGGAAAVAFEIAMKAVGVLVLGTATPSIGGIEPWRALVGALLAAAVSGVAATAWTTTHRPQGVSDVICAVRVGNPDLTLRNGATSAVAALFAIGGGQSAGREGPIVQLSATVVSAIAARLELPPATARILVAAGAAAGIGASFNSPLGGAFFAMEALLGSFAVEAFAPVVVASVTGTVTGQLLLGDRLALQLPAMTLERPAELLVFPLLGVACGAVTVGMRHALRVAADGLGRLPGPPAMRTLVSGAAVGTLAAAGMPHVMGNGYALMDQLVRGEVQLGLGLLGAVLLAKVVATALAYAGKSGGGIFAPSLFLGAVTGQWVGQVAAAVAPSLAPQPGVFAVVGMGAVAAALAHTPATMALMIAEMTGNYALVLPLLVTIAIATVIGNAADPRSVYVQPLIDRGVAVDPATEAGEVAVGDVVQRDGFHTVEPSLGFEPLWQLLRDDPDTPVFVAGGAPRWVELRDLQPFVHDPARAERTAADLARPAPTIGPDESLSAAGAALVRTRGRAIAVVDADGRVVGLVTGRKMLGVWSDARR